MQKNQFKAIDALCLKLYFQRLPLADHSEFVTDVVERCGAPVTRKTFYNWRAGYCGIPTKYKKIIEKVAGEKIFHEHLYKQNNMSYTLSKRIVNKVSIVDLLSRFTELQQQDGEFYEGVCPFTNDPSHMFIVRPWSKGWECLHCKASGNAVDFIRKKFNRSEEWAERYIADMYGMESDLTAEEHFVDLIRGLYRDIDLKMYVKSIAGKDMASVYKVVKSVPGLNELFISRLAAVVGVTPRTMMSYISGQRPGEKKRKRIADFLHLDPYILFGADDKDDGIEIDD